MTKEERDLHNEKCLTAYQKETAQEGDALPWGLSLEEAREMAEVVYLNFWPEHTTHRQWAESFNIKDDLRRLIMDGKKLEQ